MISVLTDNIFQEHLSKGDAFRPRGFAFIVIYDGSITIELNESIQKFSLQSLILITANHSYRLIDYSPDLRLHIVAGNQTKIKSKINFNFNRYELYQLLKFDTKGLHAEIDAVTLDNLRNQIGQLDDCLKNPATFTFGNEIINSIFTTIVYMIFSKFLGSPGLTNDQRKEDLTIQFLDLISQHYQDRKDLKFYADSLNITVRYLSMCTSEITGHSPKTFIDDIVITEAKKMLFSKSHSIKYTATLLGFSDQYVFGKFFKKHTGLSPKHYRDQYKKIKSF